MADDLNLIQNNFKYEQELYLSTILNIQDYLKDYCDISKDKIIKEADGFFQVKS